MRAELLVSILVLTAIAGCHTDPEPAAPETSDCDRVLAHVTELRSERGGRIGATEAWKARRAHGLARALGPDYLRACEAAPRPTVSCLLAATTPAELDACPQPSLEAP